MSTTQQQVDACLRSKLENSVSGSVDELIIAACAGAMEIEAARQENGLPHTVPAPWPTSTREYQSRWTRIHHAM